MKSMIPVSPPAVTIKHEISFKEYMLKEAAEDSLVNLAVVIEDVESQERVLASEEFNIRTPSLDIQVYVLCMPNPCCHLMLSFKKVSMT